MAIGNVGYTYVLCFDGDPQEIRDRDYLRADMDSFGINYPITHYVGFTMRNNPTIRVKEHGARYINNLVALYPYTDEDDEARIKWTKRCPKCGKDLWYFAESPTYQEQFSRHRATEIADNEPPPIRIMLRNRKK